MPEPRSLSLASRWQPTQPAPLAPVFGPRTTAGPMDWTPLLAADSYLVSSFDLQRGLEASVLRDAQLPPELLRELQRLQACWREDQARA